MANGTPAKRLERRRDWSLPATPQRKQGEIVVVDGFGVSVRVERSRLVVTDGAGRNRLERRYGRATSEISRLVVLGGSGSLSLDAVRWLADVGASLVCIDRDGALMVTSAPTKAEAKLRRAQALAPYNETGLAVARELLRRKLEGQQQVLDRLDPDPHPRRVLERCLADGEEAGSIAGLTTAEAEGAAAYWGAWADVEVRFQPADRDRVPDEWRRFGTRTSPIGGGPRMAVNPAGAILNYLYALLEAEARLACLTVGLDPAIAIVHADIRGRDSLPLDLMEAVRPSVDRYLLALLRDRVFRASDFHETQRGNVRLLAPLTHELAETMPAWRRLIAPVAERVASMLMKNEPKLERLPTPLTEGNRRTDRARRHGAGGETPAPRQPRLEQRCKRCGGRLPHRDRVYCDDCLPLYRRDQYDAYAQAGVRGLAALRDAGADPSHGGDAGKRRGATQSRQQRERREWEAANPGASADPETFRREILPGTQGVPLSELAQATGLSLMYVSQIRRGIKTPHPKHWGALREAPWRSQGLPRGQDA
jgi:CRISPR-associated endonuclease Cas1